MTEEQKKRPSHLRVVQPDERPSARPKYSADDVEAYLKELGERFPGPEAEAHLESFRHHRCLFEQLAAAREEAGLSQSEVAKQMFVSRVAIEKLESGLGNPLFSTIERYVAILGKKIEWHIS
ncbi:MAG TPA: helix-turn-helix transcriptional regulator [Ktedonobacterales bacterium]|jgi:DNA-binding XRE family transcriptional regulator